MDQNKNPNKKTEMRTQRTIQIDNAHSNMKKTITIQSLKLSYCIQAPMHMEFQSTQKILKMIEHNSHFENFEIDFH